MRRRINLKVLLMSALAVAFVLFCRVVGSAFTSCPPAGFPIFPSECTEGHWEITVGGAAPLGFSWAALSRLAGADVGVDEAETRYLKLNPIDPGTFFLFPEPKYRGEHHFDRAMGMTNEVAFWTSVDYMLNQRDQVINLLTMGTCSDVGQALDALGRALHALQDAYSHSNYVDGLNTAEQLSFKAALRARFQPLPSRLLLTSYDPLAFNDPEEPDDPVYHYQHRFLSKDYPGKNPEATLYFTAAFNAAMTATTDFINGIKGEVGADNWGKVSNFGMPDACQERQPPCDTCTPASLTVQGVASLDPNDKTGSHGVGTEEYISGDTPLRYLIDFENQNTATAAAQRVVIQDQLNIGNEDLSTLTLGPITIPNKTITPAIGPGDFSATLDLRPTNNLLVALNTHLNVSTGLLTWTFQSLDPSTGKPPTDPTAGFLPPGMGGSVFFTIAPKPDLPTNTQVLNQATIVFDSNAPINTPTWSNTIDNTKPTSHVLPLPSTETSPSFTVQWTGTDVGSGIQDFTIYFSDNGGPFTVGQQQTTATSATFTGQFGHTYAFYSIARDLTGNIEDSKTAAEATTRVVLDTTPPVIVSQITGTLGTNGWYISNVTVNWSVSDPESGIASSSGCGSTTLTADTAGVTLTCSATNGAGLSSSSPVTIKIDKTPPAISGMPVAQCSIWPPNHKLVQIAAVTATDSGSGVAPGSLSVSVTSNEPVSPGDIVVANGVVKVVADRLGDGNGRVYTVVAQAADLAGNTTMATGTCTVPHDQGK